MRSGCSWPRAAPLSRARSSRPGSGSTRAPLRARRSRGSGTRARRVERARPRPAARMVEARAMGRALSHLPEPARGLPPRAAVLLHWDLDRADQPSPGGVEQPRRCPGFAAGLAGQFNRLVSRKPGTSGFARRFFRMVVLSCQWDACFVDAESFANNAVDSFPKDAELLLTRGSVREEVATIGWPEPAMVPGTTASADDIVAIWRRETLDKARHDFADASRSTPPTASHAFASAASSGGSGSWSRRAGIWKRRSSRRARPTASISRTSSWDASTRTPAGSRKRSPSTVSPSPCFRAPSRRARRSRTRSSPRATRTGRDRRCARGCGAEAAARSATRSGTTSC